MTDEIRWFRCVDGDSQLTLGKLYPATTVDEDGDLAIVDDGGKPYWVAITESYKTNIGRTKGRINEVFKEVFTDD